MNFSISWKHYFGIHAVLDVTHVVCHNAALSLDGEGNIFFFHVIKNMYYIYQQLWKTNHFEIQIYRRNQNEK